jgi:2-C-methyl-D-erythritol 2,4-cyclodiphosphate synthase
LSISIECQIPKITPKIPEMRNNIARILKISEQSIGITATTGENLTEFGKGNGISVFTIVTVE